jgi:hypothetical protein
MEQEMLLMLLRKSLPAPLCEREKPASPPYKGGYRGIGSRTGSYFLHEKATLLCRRQLHKLQL